MDRVQLLKQEWGSLGGDALDESPVPEPIEPQEDAMETAGVYLQDAANRDENVLLSRVGDDMTFQDVNNSTPVTLTDLLATSGMTVPQHANLDTLLHALSENHDITPTFSAYGVITGITIRTPGGTLVRDANFGYNSSGLITSVVFRQYDAAGSVIETLTAVYNYTSGSLDTVSVTRS